MKEMQEFLLKDWYSNSYDSFLRNPNKLQNLINHPYNKKLQSYGKPLQNLIFKKIINENNIDIIFLNTIFEIYNSTQEQLMSDACETYPLFRGMILKNKNEIYSPKLIESWSVDEKIAKGYSCSFSKNCEKTGILIKADIPKKNIFIDYKHNNCWTILNEECEKEIIVLNLNKDINFKIKNLYRKESKKL